MSESQFDELAPLHPHVVPDRPMIRARAVVERAQRHGAHTSEFWLVTLAIVAPVGLALAGVEPRRLRDVAIGAGIAAAGYALGRSYVKGSLVRMGRLDPDERV